MQSDIKTLINLWKYYKFNTNILYVNIEGNDIRHGIIKKILEN